MVLLTLAVVFGTIFLTYFAYQGGVAIANEVVLPNVDLAKGVIPNGFDLLTSPFVSFFNGILNYIITPLVVIFSIIIFFIIQYYLIKFYAWCLMKIYQIYLVIKEEDLIHLIQHPSISYNNFREKIIKSVSDNQNQNNQSEAQN